MALIYCIHQDDPADGCHSVVAPLVCDVHLSNAVYLNSSLVYWSVQPQKAECSCPNVGGSTLIMVIQGKTIAHVKWKTEGESLAHSKSTGSLSKAKSEARLSVVTERMGGRYVLGFAPALRFSSPESNSVQTLQKSFG